MWTNLRTTDGLGIFGFCTESQPREQYFRFTLRVVLMLPIGPDNAYIFRITHADNVPWMLRNGLHCPSSATQDPNYRAIGLADLIMKRAKRRVPISPEGTLSDYIPFYFTSRSPMLYNIKTGRKVEAVPMSDIIVVVAALRRLASEDVEFVFTDRHAKLTTARFSRDLDDLDWIDWGILRRSDFAYDVDDPGKMERYQAEALVHQHLPIEVIEGIICSDGTTEASVKAEVDAAGVQVNVGSDGRYFF